MKITPVDEHKNLFYVEDAFPPEIIEQLNTEELLTYPYTTEELQSRWPRRKVDVPETSVYSKLTAEIIKQRNTIANAIGIEKLWVIDGTVWLDEPGFEMTRHIDDPRLIISMQIYLNNNIPELGTTFFDGETTTVRYQVPYKFNCGYMMINGPDQSHAMITPVPANSYRVSSYNRFMPLS